MARILALFLFISGAHAAEITLVPENEPLTEATHELVWATLPWEFYTVEFANDAGGPWIPLTTAIKGDGGLFRYTFSLNLDSRLFRVRSESTQEIAPAPEGFSLIPAGAFQMGDSFSEGKERESPVHEVFVSAFFMGRTEVTWAQWREVRDWARDEGYSMGSGEGKGDDHPVHSVSWYDVVKWCNALSEREELDPVYWLGDGEVYSWGEFVPEIHYEANGYRLPSEAEWEKAARGGLSGRRFPWGDTISHELANYEADGGEAYDGSSPADYHPDYDSGVFPYTSPVGSFPANDYRLYDVTGNVWEWANDWYHRDYYGRSPDRDPRGPTAGSWPAFSWNIVVRGGSWAVNASVNRVAERFGMTASSTSVGFRVARNF